MSWLGAICRDMGRKIPAFSYCIFLEIRRDPIFVAHEIASYVRQVGIWGVWSSQVLDQISMLLLQTLLNTAMVSELSSLLPSKVKRKNSHVPDVLRNLYG